MAAHFRNKTSSVVTVLNFVPRSSTDVTFEIGNTEWMWYFGSYASYEMANHVRSVAQYTECFETISKLHVYAEQRRKF
jgi:hypothetical protein